MKCHNYAQHLYCALLHEYWPQYGSSPSGLCRLNALKECRTRTLHWTISQRDSSPIDFRRARHRHWDLGLLLDILITIGQPKYHYHQDRY